MTHLTREQFASALRKGQGRAMLHVREHGLDDVADLILEACLHNQVYDWQVEGSRADWLFKMIDGLVDYPRYRKTILTAFSTATETRDLLQLCRFVEAMVDRGDEEAREELRKFVYRTVQKRQKDDWLDTYAVATWVSVEGYRGLLEIARFYGERLLSDPDDAIDSRNVTRLEDWEIEIDYLSVLQEAALGDVAIRKFLDYLEDRRAVQVQYPLPRAVLVEEARERRKKFRREFPLKKILENASKKVGKRPGNYRQFGKYATPREIDSIYRRLLETTEKDERTRLLWVFCSVAMPSLALVIFDWANDEHRELRMAAINALAKIRDPRIYDLARSKLQRGELTGPDSNVLNLFRENYDHKVAELITSALKTVAPDDEDCHNLGMSIVALFSKHKDKRLTNPLRWVYANTPCSFCRKSAVDDLFEAGALDDEMLHECLYDANDEIRDFVTGLIQK